MEVRCCANILAIVTLLTDEINTYVYKKNKNTNFDVVVIAYVLKPESRDGTS